MIKFSLSTIINTIMMGFLISHTSIFVQEDFPCASSTCGDHGYQFQYEIDGETYIGTCPWPLYLIALPLVSMIIHYYGIHKKVKEYEMIGKLLFFIGCAIVYFSLSGDCPNLQCEDGGNSIDITASCYNGWYSFSVLGTLMIQISYIDGILLIRNQKEDQEFHYNRMVLPMLVCSIIWGVLAIAYSIYLLINTYYLSLFLIAINAYIGLIIAALHKIYTTKSGNYFFPFKIGMVLFICFFALVLIGNLYEFGSNTSEEKMLIILDFSIYGGGFLIIGALFLYMMFTKRR